MASNHSPPPDSPKKSTFPISVAPKQDDRFGRGRTYIATRKIEPGEFIWVSKPHSYPASLSTIYLFCSNCYRELLSEPLRCSTCNVARFCSTKCLEFSHPKLLCNALPSLISGDPMLPQDSLFISADSKWPPDLLFLLCAYNLRPDSLLEFISLQSNSDFIPDDPWVGTLHSKLTSLIHSDLIPDHFSPEITSYLLSNKEIHSFPIFLNPTHPRFDVCGANGVCAYDIHLMLSMVNHECLPNACVFNFFDPEIQNFVKIFTALRQIDEASEIFISYLPMNAEYGDRQRILLEKHGFRCDCVRCNIERGWKKEQDDESGNRKRGNWKKRSKRTRGTGGEEREVSNAGCNRYPHSKFLERHVCECGGWLAPFLPSDDWAIEYSMHCSICGEIVRKDKHAKDIRKNKHAIAKDVREDEQAVAEDVRQLMSKLLPKMSEKMSKLLLKKLELVLCDMLVNKDYQDNKTIDYMTLMFHITSDLIGILSISFLIC